MRMVKNVATVALILVITTLRLHAQVNGCDDSPENPTLILGLVAMGGAGGLRVRNWWRNRRKSENGES